MVQHGCDDQDRHAKEISRLEHELSEASGSLKQFLATNFDYAEKLSREVAEREKAQHEASEAEHRATKMANEVPQLNKMVGEGEGKILALNAEVTRLEAAKKDTKVELDCNFDLTLELLKQSFLQAV